MLGYVALILLACLAVAIAWARIDAAAPPAPPSLGHHAPSPAAAPMGFVDAADPLAGAPRMDVEANGRSFQFAFVHKGDQEGWRIYILRQPPYRGRATGAHETHRFRDADLRLHYICIHPDRQPIAEPADAMSLARMWAGGTVRYIDTGQQF